MALKNLIDFLQIEIAKRKAAQLAGPLHIVLWQLGLISLAQLELVFDWLEIRS